jgi:hypothetical protein
VVNGWREKMDNKSLVAGLTMTEFVGLRTYIVEGFARTGQTEQDGITPIGNAHVASMLLDFEDIFPDGCKHMLNFVKWGHENDCSEDWILDGITHDLFGMHTRLMSPRTGDY